MFYKFHTFDHNRRLSDYCGPERKERGIDVHFIIVLKFEMRVPLHTFALSNFINTGLLSANEANKNKDPMYTQYFKTTIFHNMYFNIRLPTPVAQWFLNDSS